MSERARRHPGNIRFVELMRAGEVAYATGKRQKAHHIWRRAAMLRPYDEQVWLALLNVIDSEEDRRVCLENIIAINPHNLQAQYQLTSVPGRRSAYATGEVIAIPMQDMVGWRYILLRMAEGVLLGALLGLAISLLVYR